MAIILRVFVVIFAFFVASFAAALVITIAIAISEIGSVVTMSPYGAWVSVGFFGFIFSGLGLLPAFLVIVLAEGFRFRSVFFYTIVGGLGFVALYLGVGTVGEATGEMSQGRGLEIVAAAGIVAGFVYWAIAGRNAGNWQSSLSRNPPAGDPDQPPPVSSIT